MMDPTFGLIRQKVYAVVDRKPRQITPVYLHSGWQKDESPRTYSVDNARPKAVLHVVVVSLSADYAAVRPVDSMSETDEFRVPYAKLHATRAEALQTALSDTRDAWDKIQAHLIYRLNEERAEAADEWLPQLRIERAKTLPPPSPTAPAPQTLSADGEPAT